MTRTLNYVTVTTFGKIKLMQIVKLIASDFPVVRINVRYKCEEGNAWGFFSVKVVILNEVFE